MKKTTAGSTHSNEEPEDIVSTELQNNMAAPKLSVEASAKSVKLGAAYRLKASRVEARPLSDTQKKELINKVKQRCKCDEETARHYLIDGDWSFDAAVDSFDGDKAHGLHAMARLKVMAADDNGDGERIKQLQKQIREFEIDVKEIEDDNEDASYERKHLESLRAELRKLKDKKGMR